jgi:hypothetical protein
VPLDRIRQVLYNVEKFRGDAMKLPSIGSIAGDGSRINSFSAKTDGGPIYGAGAKSAGSINEKL